MAKKRRKSSSRRSSGSKKADPMTLALSGGVYGFARNKVNSFVRGIVGDRSKLNASDELLLGGIGYMAATRGKGMVQDAGRAMLTVESAMVGMGFGRNGTTQQTSSTNEVSFNV